MQIDRGGVQQAGIHPRQGEQDRDKARGVEQQCRRDFDLVDDEAGDGRSEDTGGIEGGRVERHRVEKFLAPHHLDHESLPDGVIDRSDQAENRGEDVDMPELDMIGGDQHAKNQRLDHRGELGGDQGGAFGHPVGQQAAIQ